MPCRPATLPAGIGFPGGLGAIDDEGLPWWARCLIAAHIWVIGAAIGGIDGGSWGGVLVGLFVATPFAMLTIIAPGAILAILSVVGLFGCDF